MISRETFGLFFAQKLGLKLEDNFYSDLKIDAAKAMPETICLATLLDGAVNEEKNYNFAAEKYIENIRIFNVFKEYFEKLGHKITARETIAPTYDLFMGKRHFVVNVTNDSNDPPHNRILISFIEMFSL